MRGRNRRESHSTAASHLLSTNSEASELLDKGLITSGLPLTFFPSLFSPPSLSPFNHVSIRSLCGPRKVQSPTKPNKVSTNKLKTVRKWSQAGPKEQAESSQRSSKKHLFGTYSVPGIGLWDRDKYEYWIALVPQCPEKEATQQVWHCLRNVMMSECMGGGGGRMEIRPRNYSMVPLMRWPGWDFWELN